MYDVGSSLGDIMKFKRNPEQQASFERCSTAIMKYWNARLELEQKGDNATESDIKNLELALVAHNTAYEELNDLLPLEQRSKNPLIASTNNIESIESVRNNEDDEDDIDVGFTLTDAQKMAREHPETFGAPNKTDLMRLNVGDNVKLEFNCEGNSERMWVEIVEIRNHLLYGTIKNNPVSMPFEYDSGVIFVKNNIFQINSKYNISTQ